MKERGMTKNKNCANANFIDPIPACAGMTVGKIGNDKRKGYDKE
jgi:hypothetical protein